jgi:hypothetical protein
MKLSALLAPLAVASVLVPAVAVASEEASHVSEVRAALSLHGVFGVLSPVEGAMVTGLLVFAFGCVIAVVVARRIDRNRETEKASPDELMAPVARANPAAFQAYLSEGAEPMSTLTPTGLMAHAYGTAAVHVLHGARSGFFADERRAMGSGHRLALPPAAESTPTLDAPAPVRAPSPSAPATVRVHQPVPVPGASSPRALADVGEDHEPEATLVGFPPPRNLPVERPSQRQTMQMERSGIVPSKKAGLKHLPESVQELLESAELAHLRTSDAYESDPDATTELVRGRTLGSVDQNRIVPAAGTPAQTMLPPAKVPTIRPIPISPPREAQALAAAPMNDLCFDDAPTEIGAPIFEAEELQAVRANAKVSEIRAVRPHGPASDVNETQAFMLVKSS